MSGKRYDNYPKLILPSKENSLNQIWFENISEKSSILGKPKKKHRYVLNL